MSAVDDHVFIGAEQSFNLFTVRKNSDATTEARMHLGCTLVTVLYG